jgi:1-acyl-sn-glycerol-3-phosphate acyltransferase
VAPTTLLGLEHLRFVEGPVIFAANHASHVDTPLLLASLPLRFRHRTVVAAASDYFFDRTWKAALWSFCLAAIPIERSKVNRRSADTAAELLEDDWNLVIFPEGGRSADGWAQPFRGGAAYMARRTGCPVIPVYLHGTRHILGKGSDPGIPQGGSGTENRLRHGLRRSPVTVIFGRPLTPRQGEDARRFSARLEAEVAALADEAGSDYWSARRRAAAGTSPSPQGPKASPWRRSWALPVAPGEEPPAPGQRAWPKV